MKAYPEIPGPSKAPKLPCLGFYKFDGSCTRYEWSRKRSWHKYGTRRRLFDASDPEFGPAIQIFQETYADDIARVLTDNKHYRGVEVVTVYCEYFGPSSFSCYQNWKEPHELVLFDVELYKKGFVAPRDFVTDFGHLKIPSVVYEGNCNDHFVQDVKDGRYPVAEGVVAKGVLESRKPPHNLWRAKVKTQWWIDELKRRAQTDPAFRQALSENTSEQGSGR